MAEPMRLPEIIRAELEAWASGATVAGPRRGDIVDLLHDRDAMHATAGDMLAALEAWWVVAENNDYSDEDWIIARQRTVVAIAAARSGAPRPDVLGEALDQIASMRREGELLDDSDHLSLGRECCERSVAAAFSELDRVIVLAREARGGAA